MERFRVYDTSIRQVSEGARGSWYYIAAAQPLTLFRRGSWYCALATTIQSHVALGSLDPLGEQTTTGPDPRQCYVPRHDGFAAASRRPVLVEGAGRWYCEDKNHNDRRRWFRTASGTKPGLCWLHPPEVHE